MLNLEKAQ